MGIDSSNEMLERIAQLLGEDVEYAGVDTLLHAELAHNFVAPSIFKNLGNHLLYREPDLNRLGAALLDLWEGQRGEDRWAEIEYRLHDGRFDVTYVFPDAIDPDEASLDRRARIVRRYFGDKPVVYPPWDADDGDSWPL